MTGSNDRLKIQRELWTFHGGFTQMSGLDYEQDAFYPIVGAATAAFLRIYDSGRLPRFIAVSKNEAAVDNDAGFSRIGNKSLDLLKAGSFTYLIEDLLISQTQANKYHASAGSVQHFLAR